MENQGLLQYGTLGTINVGLFEEKWADGTTFPGQPILGSADIQSLADCGNRYELVNGIWTLPALLDFGQGLPCHATTETNGRQAYRPEAGMF
jgi:hypothetical protein